MRYGRVDASGPEDCSPEGNLPDAEAGPGGKFGGPGGDISLLAQSGAITMDASNLLITDAGIRLQASAGLVLGSLSAGGKLSDRWAASFSAQSNRKGGRSAEHCVCVCACCNGAGGRAGADDAPASDSRQASEGSAEYGCHGPHGR